MRLRWRSATRRVLRWPAVWERQVETRNWRCCCFSRHACFAAAGAPRILYSKSFPGSVPAYVSVELNQDGKGVYKEAPDDESPVQLQAAGQDTDDDLRSRRKARALQEAAGIEPEGREHGHEDLPL